MKESKKEEAAPEALPEATAAKRPTGWRRRMGYGLLAFAGFGIMRYFGLAGLAGAGLMLWFGFKRGWHPVLVVVLAFVSAIVFWLAATALFYSVLHG